MVLAVRTTISTFDIWVLMVVMVALLAFWLTAIFLADRSQVLTSGQSWRKAEREGVTGNAWTAGSLPGEQPAEIPGEAVHEPIGVQGRHARPAAEEPGPEADSPTRPDLPARSTGRPGVPGQRTRPARPGEPVRPGEPAQPTGRHALPAQRTGDADRAERGYAGPLPPDQDETGHRPPSRWRWILTRGGR
jgi:hypothetical protein